MEEYLNLLQNDLDSMNSLINRFLNGSIIDVQKSMFIDFFGFHIIDYLC